MASLGFTKNGFVRKRFIQFLDDFKNKIEASGAFPGQTTLSDPDKYAGTPLVELATIVSASNHDMHEVAESFAQNLNPRDAEGAWLDSHAVLSGLRRKDNESDEKLRRRLMLSSNAFARSQTGKGTLANVLDLPGVEHARISTSTIDRPIEGIPAPGAMLSVLGDFDNDQVSQVVWDTAQIGVMNWVGEESGKAMGIDNKCHSIRFNSGCRVYIAACIDIELSDCSEFSMDDLPSILTDLFRLKYFGEQSIKPGQVYSILSKIDGIIVHDVKIARRAKQLLAKDENGEYCNAKMIYEGGNTELTPWASDEVCGNCSGEIWCECSDCEINLLPWEFADMSEAFITVNEERRSCQKEIDQC